MTNNLLLSWNLKQKGMGTSSILAAAILAVLKTLNGEPFTTDDILYQTLEVEQMMNTGKRKESLLQLQPQPIGTDQEREDMILNYGATSFSDKQEEDGKTKSEASCRASKSRPANLGYLSRY